MPVYFFNSVQSILHNATSQTRVYKKRSNICKFPIKKGSYLPKQLHILLISHTALNIEIIRIIIPIASIDCMIEVRSPMKDSLPFLVLRFATASSQRNDISFFHGYLYSQSNQKSGWADHFCMFSCFHKQEVRITCVE